MRLFPVKDDHVCWAVTYINYLELLVQINPEPYCITEYSIDLWDSYFWGTRVHKP